MSNISGRNDTSTLPVVQSKVVEEREKELVLQVSN